MKFQTRISVIEDNDVTIRGEKLSDLVRSWKFSDAIFLELSGRKATEKESILFEKMLVSVLDHGMGTTSSLSTRFVASGGNSLNAAVAGGVLSIGDHHGGAIEKAMQQFYAWKDLKDSEVISLVKDLIVTKKTLYGFGHKLYKDEDPRVVLILKEVEKLGLSSSFLRFKGLVEQVFREVKGKAIPLNIDGCLAMLLCEFGFDALLGKGIFIIGRTPGLVAQAYEELKYEKPVRRIEEEEIEYLGEKEPGKSL